MLRAKSFRTKLQVVVAKFAAIAVLVAVVAIITRLRPLLGGLLNVAAVTCLSPAYWDAVVARTMWLCSAVAVALMLGYIYADTPAEVCFRKHRTPSSQRWRTSGGDAHVLRWTSQLDCKPDVVAVCLHGTFDSAHAFAAWAEELCISVEPDCALEVLAVDLPGHGLTGPWEPSHGPCCSAALVPYTRDADVAFLREVLEHAGLVGNSIRGQLVLVGHSLGGAVAIAYAAQHPTDVHGLLLISPWGLAYRTARPEEWWQCSPLVSIALSPHFRAIVCPVLSVARYITPLMAARWIIPSAFSRGTDSLALRLTADRMHALILREGNRASLVRRIGEFIVEERDHRGWSIRMRRQLASVKCPVQIQWGEADEWLPASRVNAFTDALACGGVVADVHLLPMIGHCVVEGAPHLSATIAGKFMWNRVHGSCEGQHAASDPPASMYSCNRPQRCTHDGRLASDPSSKAVG